VDVLALHSPGKLQYADVLPGESLFILPCAGHAVVAGQYKVVVAAEWHWKGETVWCEGENARAWCTARVPAERQRARSDAEREVWRWRVGLAGGDAAKMAGRACAASGGQCTHGYIGRYVARVRVMSHAVSSAAVSSVQTTRGNQGRRGEREDREEGETGDERRGGDCDHSDDQWMIGVVVKAEVDHTCASQEVNSAGGQCKRRRINEPTTTHYRYTIRWEPAMSLAKLVCQTKQAGGAAGGAVEVTELTEVAEEVLGGVMEDVVGQEVLEGYLLGPGGPGRPAHPWSTLRTRVCGCSWCAS
jgi:hypothetical protein